MLTFDDHQVSVFLSFETSGAGPESSTFAGLVKDVSQDEIEGSSAEQFDRHAPRSADIWVPELLRTGFDGQYADEPVFKVYSGNDAGDLYLPIQQQLSGASPDHCRVYSLTDNAMELLNGGRVYESKKWLTDHQLEHRWIRPENQKYHRIAFILSNAALRRLKAATPNSANLPGLEIALEKGKNAQILPIRVSDCRIYAFATNRFVCRMSFQLSSKYTELISQTALTELADHLGRFANLVWLEEPSRYKDAAQTDRRVLIPSQFSVGSLVSRMVFGGRAILQPDLRAFTHSFGLVSEDSEVPTKQSLVALGEKLARQYTDDYALSDGVEHGIVVSDFDNVVHVASREGTATLVDSRTDGKVIPLLKNYKEGALSQTYLPIVALNFHQLGQALSLNARSVLDIDALNGATESENLGATADNWEKLQDENSRLRNHFCFDQVSPVTMHNSWNTALRSVFALDVAEQRLAEDMADIAKRLSAAQAREESTRQAKFERRFGLLRHIGAGIGALVVGFEFLSVVGDFKEDGLSKSEAISLLIVFFGAIIAVIWSYGSWKRR